MRGVSKRAGCGFMVGGGHKVVGGGSWRGWWGSIVYGVVGHNVVDVHNVVGGGSY